MRPAQIPPLRLAFAALTATAMSIGPALAHHPMGGVTPSTFMHGLLSGLGHPVIGLDHLAFIVAVGLCAGLVAAPLALLPGLFIGATVLGVGVHLMEANLPFAEAVIALSVLVAGAGIALRIAAPLAAWVALFGIAGIFHGYAYGEAIVGAEASPLAAYFIGFAAIQFAIATGVALLVRRGSDVARAAGPRIAGGAVAGVGLVFAAEALMPF